MIFLNIRLIFTFIRFRFRRNAQKLHRLPLAFYVWNKDCTCLWQQGLIQVHYFLSINLFTESATSINQADCRVGLLLFSSRKRSNWRFLVFTFPGIPTAPAWKQNCLFSLIILHYVDFAYATTQPRSTNIKTIKCLINTMINHSFWISVIASISFEVSFTANSCSKKPKPLNGRLWVGWLNAFQLFPTSIEHTVRPTTATTTAIDSTTTRPDDGTNGTTRCSIATSNGYRSPSL